MSFLVPAPGTVLSRSIEDYPEGIVLPVNKPYRWTSADVIRKLKYAAIKHFGKKNLKVGHAGTLDPLATGVLLVCIGQACKRAQELQDHDKEYIAAIRFGATTPSYDLEKDIDERYPFEHITEDTVREALKGFLGQQEQVAPLFSAKSIDGVRAYEIARRHYRRGEPVPDNLLQCSRITIHQLELLSFGISLPSSPLDDASNASSRINVTDTSAYGFPEASVRIRCSKGTYIRAFARDLGEAVGSGAHLAGLIRCVSGDFNLGNVLSVEQALELLK